MHCDNTKSDQQHTTSWVTRLCLNTGAYFETYNSLGCNTSILQMGGIHVMALGAGCR